MISFLGTGKGKEKRKRKRKRKIKPKTLSKLMTNGVIKIISFYGSKKKERRKERKKERRVRERVRKKREKIQKESEKGIIVTGFPLFGVEWREEEKGFEKSKKKKTKVDQKDASF